MKKEQYEKPELKTEELEIGSFGQAGPSGPVQYLQPNFGICCQ
jgi:hypothetical protein